MSTGREEPALVDDPAQVDLRYVEQPDWPNGTRLACQQCGGQLVIHAHRTIDPRWAIGWCIGCKKRRIADVIPPPTSFRPQVVDNSLDEGR